MSQLRKLFKGTFVSQSQNLRSAVVPARPTANMERIQKWMRSISCKSESSNSKFQCSQLSSLIQFFNKPVKEEIHEIDWEEWRDSIQTEQFVDNLKEKYDMLKEEEYDMEKAVNQVLQSTSQEIEDMNKELVWHGAVWMNNYADYQMFLFNLEEYGNGADYLMHENYDFFYGMEADLEELVETHNYIPGSKDDINLRGYYAAQFNWGKKVISFYRHPADDFKCGKATKNILGR